ncbi:hypothetical protein ACKFKF_15595 [Phormidesmis sp. 146-12]
MTQTTQATQAPPFPPVPKFWVRFALLFRVGVAIALLITTLGLAGCTSKALALNGKPLNWTEAQRVVPQEVIQTAVQQITSTPPDQEGQLPVLATQMESKQGRIIFFNFSQSPQLCGQLGCLFAAYLEQHTQYRLVWSSYLSPNLPKHIPLLAQYEEKEMPSFIANQVEGNQLRQVVYSWDGNQYAPEQTVLNSQLLEPSHSNRGASKVEKIKI